MWHILAHKLFILQYDFQLKYLIITIGFITATLTSYAQQFVGLNTTKYSAVQQLPFNPAWVNNSDNGIEVNIFSGSILGGTNAYYIDRSWLLSGANGKGVEGQDYRRDLTNGKKNLWANVDIIGPSFTFTHKHKHYFGFYSRVRQIYRAGSISPDYLKATNNGGIQDDYLGYQLNIEKAGFTTHNFSEIAITYGNYAIRDDFRMFKWGVTLKYLMGFTAGSIYLKDVSYTQKTADSIGTLTGNVAVQNTYNARPFVDNNVANDFSNWFNRAGRGGLGFDIGVQYEYHPNGNPNSETDYVYSIAASITDIGGIGYVADTGSGSYSLNTQNITNSTLALGQDEHIAWYAGRLEQDSVVTKNEDFEKFRVGLPTAFRLNSDWNVRPNFNISVNMLLNLKGNSKNVYRASYVSYFNITPTYIRKNFQVGIPFTYIGYQTLAMGANFRIGPLFIGSSSILSSLASDNLRNFDAYAGIIFKIKDLRKPY